ncbi:MAG: hypothetical protein OEM22_01510 [Acidimicrobiia bacterium]|nr:hypothetical protein [Acidimicrobiia bacterium]MDH3469836.1 hypothetical protein [Acidimicrobiia bacterium]
MTERGAAGVLLLAVAGLLAVALVAVAASGQYLAATARAAVAADAAALAAAPVTFRPYGARGLPSEEASRFALANGARLISCRCPVDESWEPRTVEVRTEVTVTVVMMGPATVTAVGRATFSPPLLIEQQPGSS